MSGISRKESHAPANSKVLPSAEASLARFWSGPARAYLAGFLGPELVGACTPP